MDSRMKTLIGAAALLVVLVVVVIVARAGDDEAGSDESLASGEKPTVEVPDGPAPEEVVIETLEEGEGEEAQPGDQLTLDYVGVLYDTGEEFDSSYDSGQPLPVQLGAGGVIPGFDEGLQGIKSGEQRQIIIPPDQGYGRQGQPPTIPPDSTLIFVVDALSVG
ncbi:hypothetical protein BH24ACT23_BH24ACT23_10960 [soil metagenome]